MLPPIPAGYSYVENTTGYPCADGGCTGPLAPAFKALLNYLGVAQAPRVDVRARVNERARIYNLTRKGFRPRPPTPPPTAESGARPTGKYCCICGLVGGCFTSGGDCRTFDYALQRSKGEC
jgi:hypothetical protein